MPSLSELPSDISKKKFIRSLQRLGFLINTKGGDGSHCKAVWKNEKSVTIPYTIHKNTLYYLLKEIENCSGITWKRIKSKM